MHVHIPRILMAPLLLTVILIYGCTSKSETTKSLETTGIVMIDTKTAETFQLESVDSYPAINPTTGQKTLMPTLYCPSCGKWYPVPPPEEAQRNPESRKCPKDGGPLVVDGPLQ